MKVCNFCGKSQEQVKRMIAAKNGDICDECVLLCVQVLIDNVITEYKELPFNNEK